MLLPFFTPLLPSGPIPRLDLRVLGFLFGIATLCGVLAGLAPVLCPFAPR